MGIACLQGSCQSNEQTVYLHNDSTTGSNLSNTTNSTMYEICEDKHKVCKIGPIRKKLLYKKAVSAQRQNFYSQYKYSVVDM